MIELGLKVPTLSTPANALAACRYSSERSAAHAEPATEWKVEEAVSQKLRCYSQTASCTHRQHLVRTDDGMYLAWQAKLGYLESRRNSKRHVHAADHGVHGLGY